MTRPRPLSWLPIIGRVLRSVYNSLERFCWRLARLEITPGTCLTTCRVIPNGIPSELGLPVGGGD